MSIQRLPSGNYRAQVWDTTTGRNLSVSLVIGGPGAYRTVLQAQRAREQARRVLRDNPSVDFARPAPAERWGLPVKGEAACRNCGKPASHLHHIVPRVRSRFGRDDWRRNGLPLCQTCHHGWHNRLVDIPHDVLTYDELAFAVETVGAVWVDRNYAGSTSVAQRLRSK